ncbi:hypothetical protein [Streptomyces sp. NPDC048606]|uniref:hypothetical protein n=1 Tax=Streptomyces sp. NPDC048606 TaxID=3154726 RepID=UPI00344324D6
MTLFLVALIGVLLITLYRVFVSTERADAWAEKHFVATSYGLPPRDVLDNRRAGPLPSGHRSQERQAVADAAWEGDWKAARRYVGAAGEDWDERWSRLEFLQHVAGRDDAWLDAWRAAEPGDCDAATLLSSLMVHRAWEIRGSGYAHQVPTSDMNRFREMLPAAIEEARKAALLDPANPGPWVVMITAARGARYSRARFQQLWAELMARAPHHYEGHWQALQYWCAKWYGSNRLMMRFAREAVHTAPAGSPLAGIYLHALDELAERSGSRLLPVTPVRRRLLKRIAASFDQVAPDDEHLPVLRHLLAHHLVESMLYTAALEQFRRIGPWCGAEPWRAAGNPVMAFEKARGRAAKLSRTRPTPAGQVHRMAR